MNQDAARIIIYDPESEVNSITPFMPSEKPKIPKIMAHAQANTIKSHGWANPIRNVEYNSTPTIDPNRPPIKKIPILE